MTKFRLKETSKEQLKQKIDEERTILSIVNKFKNKFIELALRYDKLVTKNCYCGITDDITRREEEHNTRFVDTFDCESFDIASRVEAALGVEGFDIGRQSGHGDPDKTTWVYMYIKTADTTESKNYPKGDDYYKGKF